MVSIKTDKRELDHIRLPLRLFCVLRSEATEGASNHSIRAKRPQGKLRRPEHILGTKTVIPSLSMSEMDVRVVVPNEFPMCLLHLIHGEV